MYFAHGLVQFCTRQLHWRESGRQDLRLSLRPREHDCLYWAARGKSAAETAVILGLQTETVRKYLKTALARLNARTKAQAVAKALQWGLLELAAP
jgi:DNA-binding CsgD family transcriptional regulator